MINFIYNAARRNYPIRRVLQELDFIAWKLNKNRNAPTLAKYWFFKNYVKSRNIKTIIETGTYLGDFVITMKKDFERIYSIELSDYLYQRATRRMRNLKNVKLLQGDSSNILPKLLGEIESQCGFWLDAHASGGITAKGPEETPIVHELRTIMDHARSKDFNHVILIDDASNFGASAGYPSLLELQNVVKEYDRRWQISVTRNIITVARS